MNEITTAETAAADAEPEARAGSAPPAEGAASTPGDAHTALLLGFATVALIDAVVLIFSLPGRVSIGTRALTHVYSAGQILALGLVVTGGVAALRRFGPRSRLLGFLALAALSWGLSYPVLAEDVSGLADRLARKVAVQPLWVALLTLVVALSLPIAAGLSRWLSRPRLWAVGFGAGVVVAIVNGVNHSYPGIHLLVSQSYPGVHLLVTVVAAVVIGTSLQGGPLAAGTPPRWARAKPALIGAAALVGAFAIAVWPNNAVSLELRGHAGAVLFPFLGPLHPSRAGESHVPEDQKEWFADRSKLPPIPPSAPSLLPKDAIVILLGIDSMRGDLLNDEKNRADLPELFRLRDESVFFSNARAAGSSTAPSLTALFSGVYYSQLYWTRGDTNDSLVYPHEDKSPRFPELLAKAGVKTITYEGTSWLLNRFGIVHGFTEERSLRKTGYPLAKQMVAPVISRLKKRDDTPRFFFVHFLDAHSPYKSGGKKATPFKGYLAELGLVDKQLKRLLDTLRLEGLLDRTCLMVMADHGEAFGEHGMTWHAMSVYEELLRVPLLVRLPGAKARVVRDPVSLVDIGPTVLDLMGVATPATYMGQSLTGYLRGEQPKLTRPIVAEARLKRAMILPDGVKVIHDTRAHAVEIYDLDKDPREEHNLYREGDESTARRLGTLGAFFQANTLKRPGYSVPYRKW